MKNNREEENGAIVRKKNRDQPLSVLAKEEFVFLSFVFSFENNLSCVIVDLSVLEIWVLSDFCFFYYFCTPSFDTRFFLSRLRLWSRLIKLNHLNFGVPCD